MIRSGTDSPFLVSRDVDVFGTVLGPGPDPFCPARATTESVSILLHPGSNVLKLAVDGFT